MNHPAVFPGLDADQQDSAQVAALACGQVHPESALPSRRAEVSDIDKHLDAMRAAMASGSWTPASHLPDADTTVMLALADGEVWQGYYDGEAWIEVSGLRLAPGRVTYWQHTPKHPEDRA